MIKILIVLEEEDGIDFRAYSLQISSTSEDLPPHVKLRLIETNEEPGIDNAVKGVQQTGFQANCRYTMPQSGRALETRQIFMN
ncbi:MAG: hypothetical protein ABSB38_09150 [Dehalococcoidia bacterium]|jgi:hypothetical protein